MKIFVISLKNSIDRRESITKQLALFSGEWEFFDAVNAKEGLPERLESMQADKYRKIFRSRPLSVGEKGCYASHYLLWEKCVEINENIVILEDDIIITKHFLDTIQHLHEYHKLYQYIKIEPANCQFKKVNYDGTFQIARLLDNDVRTSAYSITPKAADQYLKHSQKWRCAVDNYIGQSYLHNIASYTILPYAVYPSDYLNLSLFESTIQLEKTSKVILPLKAPREIARFYRFIRLNIWNFLYKEPKNHSENGE